MNGSLELKIYCDGGARGNPGPAACAFVVLENEKIVHKEGKFLGEGTNNFAEYSGVLNAFSWLSKNNGKYKGLQINFYLDSQLVVKQLMGEYKIKNEKLKGLFDVIKEYEQTFGAIVSYTFIPREKNRLADFLVNKTLDGKSS